MHGMKNDRRLRIGPRALMRTLTWLRMCAIGGQLITVFVVFRLLHLDIPALHLVVGIGSLAVFCVISAWRLSQPWTISEVETLGHIVFDILVLTYLLYFSGGATNAFVTLLLVPIALSAAVLSTAAVVAVSLLSGTAYIALLHWYVPLPPIDTIRIASFHLHDIGLAISFVITAALLAFFVTRLAAALRIQQQEVHRIRERALRDEGILAIATQAAGAAHEMNTPLSTLRTLLPELRREHPSDTALTSDLTLLETQVERCRTILREMVALGRAHLKQEAEHITLEQFITSCLQRFALLRPEAELICDMPPQVATARLRVQPGLRHAVVNLLNNAADASAHNQFRQVTFRVRVDMSWLELIVSDRGTGFASTEELVELGRSGKHSGLGLGLALAEATAERLNGELLARNTEHGGEICLRLPLHALAMC